MQTKMGGWKVGWMVEFLNPQCDPLLFKVVRIPPGKQAWTTSVSSVKMQMVKPQFPTCPELSYQQKPDSKRDHH